MITLQFSSEKDLSSATIRWFTWSQISHVDIVLPDKNLLGARFNSGVQIRPKDYMRFTKIIYAEVDYEFDPVYKLVSSQVGKAYDWRAILNFGLHRNWQEDDRWFCSELIAWAFLRAGYPLINPGVETWRVTPQDLLKSVRINPLDEIGGRRMLINKPYSVR